MVNGVRDQLWDKLSAIRHPGTGEFPTVVIRGDNLEDIRLSIEGTPELLQIMSQNMSDDEQNATKFTPLVGTTPKAFLSYSFEDKELAESIARGLMAKGIDTWWAEWEIKPGDSLRRKIDDGLGNCTHFIVLLSPSAMQRPWVQEEMDAGLIRQIGGQARFITLRYGVSSHELPPLLIGKLAPEVSRSSLERDIRDLVNDIHGVSRKPELGKPPSAAALPATGFSNIATAIAKVFVESTQEAMFADPQIAVEELMEAVDASEEDVEDAVHELRDFVQESFGRILPKAELFAEFDKHFMDWSPEDDALRIAADLVNDADFPHEAGQIAELYGWDCRRMNPALSYLLARRLIVDYNLIAHDYVAYRVVKNDATRRFVKSRS
ncbi:MAG: toll/interleukin-1 receptor domain-containing protein [Alphaproteobacteria bacterium]|nr:toll/interleukin-1 receptor domain-containing protein [Alphaproteobacteria bacterium]MBU1549659.1 toll/interleukin-1 receptor domain-containing protein [Alphaproteobacteria bacterium]MBU2336514.1 toll/interleukin-1 receptor domain-containing protein [Alphaproteobacteria bacterium]MBU2387605.1 toll/interleukin-1 receptor domain-containing protein [Alphaproteobacteria bacterium]